MISKYLICELNLSEEEFLKSKLNGVCYNGINALSHHIKKFNYNLDTYIHTFYSESIPKCVISGEPSDWRLSGYWNKWFSIKRKYKKYNTAFSCIKTKIEKIKEEGYYSIYLEWEYWKNKKTFIEYIELMYFLFDQDTSYYRRLCNNYFNSNYKESFILKYRESILNKTPLRFPMGKSISSFIEMGNTPEQSEILFEKWRSNCNSTFKNPEVQKHNSNLFLKKYSKQERRKFNIHCVEYWINKNYSLDEAVKKISELQKLNTVENIASRNNCTLDEALDIQTSIYKKRSCTFNNKTSQELQDIYARQDSSSFKYCLKKCLGNLDCANKLYRSILKRGFVPFGKASKESLRIFLQLYKFLRKNGISREDIYFGIGGSKEYFLYDTETHTMRFYDFVILSKKIIIEYDGIYWHSFEKSKLIDIAKDKIAALNGFKIFRIKSEDIDKLEKLNRFLYENLQITNTDWKIIPIS